MNSHFQPRQRGRCQERAQDRFRNAAKVTSGSILNTHTYGTRFPEEKNALFQALSEGGGGPCPIF